MRSREEEASRKQFSICLCLVLLELVLVLLGLGLDLVDLGLVGLGLVLVVGDVGGAVGGFGFGVLGALLLLRGSVRARSRGSQNPASRHNGPALATPRSLRWVRGLLPGDEGAAWLTEVTSCLAETPEPGERRRYVRSYRRSVPSLIWTSWTEHLSATRQRELS